MKTRNLPEPLMRYFKYSSLGFNRLFSARLSRKLQTGNNIFGEVFLCVYAERRIKKEECQRAVRMSHFICGSVERVSENPEM